MGAPRGYVRYVERSVARGRTGLTTVVEEELEDDETLVESSAGKIDAAVANDRKEVYTSIPESGVKEVLWHRGLESWEVRIEAHGYKMLGGYFKPQDGSDEARDRALIAAMERRQILLETPPS